MSWLTHIPDGLRVIYEWSTNVLTARDGTEQRIALRQKPRQKIVMDYLSDSNRDIQQWRYELFSKLDNQWQAPLWAEAERITAAITATDTTVAADFTQMDDVLGDTGTTGTMMLLHPDGETYEIILCTLPRAAGLATLASGTIANDYPLGTLIVPVEQVFVDNNSNYSAAADNAADLTINMVAKYSNGVVGKGAEALTTYNSLPVLDKRPLADGANDTFWENIQRIDYGHKILLQSEQTYSNIGSARSYKLTDKDDRQWWKLFLATVKGQQKTFYCSTYREDMTVATQPTVGGFTFTIYDDASVANGWKSSGSHQSLAIEMADGSLVYRTLYGAGTVDNGDGTHTVYVTQQLPLGIAITRVSFLELVRLADDSVQFEYNHDGSIVGISVRTIITPVVAAALVPLTATGFGFGARPFGMRTFGPSTLITQPVPPAPSSSSHFGGRPFGQRTFGPT